MTISAWESDPMARDNAACNRAIRKAWARERELVLAGKGSRNWTPEQREQLITKGKVYDADGKAFIGQHMKSVSGFPDNQGDADNIQFLSQEEHLEAHKGDWHTVTNWYYDPDTKTFYDFDVYDYSKFPPDDYINFNPEEALIPDESPAEKPLKKPTKEKKQPKNKKEEPPKTNPTNTEMSKAEPSKKTGHLSKFIKGAKSVFTETVKPVITDTIWSYVKEHPLQTIAVITTAVGKIKGVVSQNSSNNGGGKKSSTTDIFCSKNISNSESTQDKEKNNANDIFDTPKRPYTPNDVPAGRQRYHYKDGTTRERERREYSRGKDKTDDE